MLRTALSHMMRSTMRWVILLGGLVGGACGDTSKRQPPDTAFDTLPAVLSNQKHVEIGFHPLGNANTFICKLDNNVETQCVPPFIADLADGPHTFSVAAALNDAVDETPSMYSWTIDTVPPETTLIAGPPALDNTLTPQITFSGTDAHRH